MSSAVVHQSVSDVSYLCTPSCNPHEHNLDHTYAVRYCEAWHAGSASRTSVCGRNPYDWSVLSKNVRRHANALDVAQLITSAK